MTKAQIIETIRDMRDRKAQCEEIFFEKSRETPAVTDIFLQYAHEREVLEDLLQAIGEK